MADDGAGHLKRHGAGLTADEKKGWPDDDSIRCAFCSESSTWPVWSCHRHASECYEYGTGAPAGAADAPATDTPAMDAPATDTPAMDVPATDTPAMDAPATDAPATDTPEYRVLWARIAELQVALQEALEHMIVVTVNCSGDKCRLDICTACYDDAEETAEQNEELYQRLREVLDTWTETSGAGAI